VSVKEGEGRGNGREIWIECPNCFPWMMKLHDKEKYG
jgi:hypothetical protein